MKASLSVQIFELITESTVECNEQLCSDRATVKVDETRGFAGNHLAKLTMVFLCPRHLSAYVRYGAGVFVDQYLVSNHQPSPLRRNGESSC